MLNLRPPSHPAMDQRLLLKSPLAKNNTRKTSPYLLSLSPLPIYLAKWCTLVLSECSFFLFTILSHLPLLCLLLFFCSRYSLISTSLSPPPLRLSLLPQFCTDDTPTAVKGSPSILLGISMRGNYNGTTYSDISCVLDHTSVFLRLRGITATCFIIRFITVI
jgi:hypothetical protein